MGAHRLLRSNIDCLLRACLKSLCASEASDGELDCREGYESCEGFGEVLIVLGEPTVAAEPREGSLDHPSTGQHDEAFPVVRALDDFEPEPRQSGDGVFDLTGIVAGVGPNELEPWKALANLVENESGAVVILHARGVDSHAQGQAFDVDEGMHFAALHLLAGVVTHRVLFIPARGSPFSAAFSDWLSMIAAVGLASRWSASRSAIGSSSQMRSHAPSRWNWRKIL